MIKLIVMLPCIAHCKMKFFYNADAFSTNVFQIDETIISNYSKQISVDYLHSSKKIYFMLYHSYI